MRIVALLLLFGIMVLAGMFKLGGAYDDPFARTMVGFGFLVFTGMVAGELAARIGIPRITGYFIAGITCGPALLNLIDTDVIERLKTVDDLALALIAFTAGGELHLTRLKKAGAVIAAITSMQAVFAFAMTGVAVMLLATFSSSFAALGLPNLIAFALFMGLIASANSPAATVAVVVETKSRGPLTDQILSVTVLKDVVIIALIAIVLTVGGWLISPTGQFEMGIIGRVLLEIAISIVAGAAVALAIVVYVSRIRREMVLFVVALSLIIVFASEPLNLHFLLICITAGFCVENFSRYGERLISAVERTSMAVYIIFFSIAGAAIDVVQLRQALVIALIFVAARLAAFVLGTSIPCYLADRASLAARYGWAGYIAQGGVGLGIARLIMKTHPDIGSAFYAIAVAAIAANDLAGPVALKLLLKAAGETAESRIEHGFHR